MTEPKTKQKRRIHSFEPDKDVAVMLDRAARSGVKMGFLVNAALRKHLPKRIETLNLK